MLLKLIIVHFQFITDELVSKVNKQVSVYNKHSHSHLQCTHVTASVCCGFSAKEEIPACDWSLPSALLTTGSWYSALVALQPTTGNNWLMLGKETFLVFYYYYYYSEWCQICIVDSSSLQWMNHFESQTWTSRKWWVVFCSFIQSCFHSAVIGVTLWCSQQNIRNFRFLCNSQSPGRPNCCKREKCHFLQFIRGMENYKQKSPFTSVTVVNFTRAHKFDSNSSCPLKKHRTDNHKHVVKVLQFDNQQETNLTVASIRLKLYLKWNCNFFLQNLCSLNTDLYFWYYF